MPSIKKSVMFSEQTQDYINARTKAEDDISWSVELNESFKSLQWLSSQLLPELTPSEWEVLLNVYSGSIVEFQIPYRISSDIMDHYNVLEVTELDKGIGDCVRKVHALSQPEQYATLDFIKKYWANDWSDADNFDDVITQIKAL